MRFLVILAAALSLGVVLALPRIKRDNCGAITGPKGKWIQKDESGQQKVYCLICLDFVEIAKTYEECGEEIVHKMLDKACIDKFGNGTVGKICTDSIDKYADELIKDTEGLNDTEICDKILKDSQCTYPQSFSYVLY